jgi:hypothetical protein
MSTGISILLATRGRTDILKRSLLSLADKAHDTSNLEILLAFDDDDTATYEWVEQNVLPELDDRGVEYSCMSFERMGYIRLNEYYNALSAAASGQWLFFWGDDAIMETQDWDTVILKETRFRLLRAKAHNEHPIAVFPIVPKHWYDMFGYFSPHQLNDNWVCQVAYMVNIVENIPVEITHDRFDLTGNNNDETYKNRPMLEGNPADPRDFHHPGWTNRRLDDCDKIADYLKSQGEDTTWWENVKINKQDPWAKLKANDVNNQMVQFQLR